MNEIRYCATGCKSNSRPRQTEGPSQLCNRCENDLHKWLREIPDLYALLPGYLLPGAVEKNPDSTTTKRSEVAAPVRLEILDLLDTRRGRIWQGTAPAHDRRGVIGTLQTYVDRLREERNLTTPHPDTNVAAACALLDRHRLWIAEQTWIDELHNDIKQLHRELSDATGNYRRPPVGRCHVIPENADTACGGPLFANNYGGVHCARCQATWDAAHLRQLGLAQAQQQEVTNEPA